LLGCDLALRAREVLLAAPLLCTHRRNFMVNVRLWVQSKGRRHYYPTCHREVIIRRAGASYAASVKARRRAMEELITRAPRRMRRNWVASMRQKVWLPAQPPRAPATRPRPM
jgi:hypothetical protein